jgi:hypothetical protein
LKLSFVNQFFSDSFRAVQTSFQNKLEVDKFLLCEEALREPGSTVNSLIFISTLSENHSYILFVTPLLLRFHLKKWD